MMNDQMQQALTALINKIAAGADTAAVQLPSALAELVAYAQFSNLIAMVCFGVSTVTILAVAGWLTWLSAKRNYDYEIAAFLLMLIGICFLFGTFVALDSYIKALYPQAYVLDYIRGMIAK